MQTIENTVEAWAGEPLRKVGSGEGKPSRYFCSRCKRQVSGVYPYPRFVKRGLTQASGWICGTCRSEVTPKQAQPEGLRRHRELPNR